MIPEMLNIEVPEVMMSQKPANYTTYTEHLQQVKELKEKIEKEKAERFTNKKSRRGPDRSQHFKMDVSQTVEQTRGANEGSGERMEDQTAVNENIT